MTRRAEKYRADRVARRHFEQAREWFSLRDLEGRVARVDEATRTQAARALALSAQRRRAAEAVWGLRYNTDTELVPFVILWFVLLGVAVWKRQPLSWIAFSAVTLLVACSSQTIDSIGRYGLLAVPLVIALAQWADRRWRSVLVACAGSVGLVVMTAQVLQGRIVP